MKTKPTVEIYDNLKNELNKHKETKNLNDYELCLYLLSLKSGDVEKPDEEQLIALGESIEHWKRMINYIKNEILNGKANDYSDEYYMYKSIKEYWHGMFCSLCKLNHVSTTRCDSCILFKNNICANGGYSLWNNINHSKYWIDWYANALVFVYAMEILLKKYKN